MARGQRDRAKRRHWQRHVAAWRQSGQSVRAYCLAHGLSEASFYGWRRGLTQRPQTAATTLAGATPAHAGATFVPVRLIEELPPCGAIEVVLRGGRVIRVTPGFAAQTLREVVAVLEERPC